MNETPLRIQNLATCYENTITIVLRLAVQQVPGSHQFRGGILAALQAAREQTKALGYPSELVQLSFSAAVAFVDESVLMLQNPVFANWQQLQVELFGHARMGEVFFEHLDGLLARPDAQEIADCLEIYGLCLLLGYRGRYALSGGGEVQTFIRQIREKMNRIRGRVHFLDGQASAPGVQRGPAADPWSRTLGIAALCLFLLMLLAYGGSLISLSSGISQLR